tara:strand:- start:1043 stop:1261 length:219 start_codon:yes stop_codon:yes gene_type:complete
MFDFMNERNKTGSKLRIAVVRNSSLPDKHPLCKGDGIDHCDYYTTIDCDECKYGGGRKDPEARCNQTKEDEV